MGMEKGQSKSGMTDETEKELVKKLLSFYYCYYVQMAFSTMLL
jgi:hypothetical protein